jgi:hypothetical protein
MLKGSFLHLGLLIGPYPLGLRLDVLDVLALSPRELMLHQTHAFNVFNELALLVWFGKGIIGGRRLILIISEIVIKRNEVHSQQAILLWISFKQLLMHSENVLREQNVPREDAPPSDTAMIDH